MYVVGGTARRLCRALVLCIFLLAVTPVLGPAFAQGTDPAQVGQWGPVLQWPSIAINMILLSSGKVIFWNRDNITRSWNPVTNVVTSPGGPGYDDFCSGMAFLPDGRVFSAGGNVVDGQGLPYASIYNPSTESWTRVANMNAGRWYPTCLTLSDGSILVLSGSMSSSFVINDLPQVWDGSGNWRDLTSGRTSLSLYPMLFLAPNGLVFNPGPNQVTRYLDTSGTGSWTTVAGRNIYRDYGSAVMYDPGKVMIVGGQDPPTASAEVIDLNAASPSWRNVAPMSIARRQLNATIMADGKVLVTGGVSGAGFNDPNTAVFFAEMWDPATETWSRMASMTQPRWYHSTAVLLPDGRVAAAGGDSNPTAEVFSPPYLFKGARPSVSSAPGGAGYGETFFVGTPDANSITNVNFVRLGSATHAFNMDQRINRLSFTRVAGGLNVTAPPNGRVAPPGYYMLFLISGNGVPSVAPMVKLGGSAPPPPSPPTPPSNLLVKAQSTSQIDLSWVDNANNEDGFAVERSTDGANFSQIATVGTNVTTYSATGLSAATAYSFRVRAYRGTSTSDYTNVATATTASPPAPLPGPPNAPAGLSASAVSSSQINLAWSDNSSDEDGFAIERSTDGTNYGQLTTVGANVTTYSNTNLNPATTYWYRVRSFRGALSSGTTTPASVATLAAPGPPPNGPPNAPSALKAVAVSNSQVNLSWTDNSGDEEGFAIERAKDGEPFSQIATVGANVTTYASVNLQSSTAYWYRVRAYRGADSSDFSSAVVVGTLAGPPDPAPPPPSPPAAPGNLVAATFSTSQINLSWSDNSGDEDGFAIERSTDGTNFGQITTVGANVTSFSNTGLGSGTTYWYRVRAFKGNLVSGYTNAASATTATPNPGPTAPKAPSHLVATTFSAVQIVLSWADDSGNEDHFILERSTDGVHFAAVATLVPNVTTFADGGTIPLTPSTTYYYRIYSQNNGGNSAFSNTANATTLVAPPRYRPPGT